ncbi:MAG: hypothetical protein MI810_18435 [Flavobacteriales bacterium]|nr:hypothetical protein [Flavobacteriales bacterium]
MARMHLFEFEDLKWFPTSIRNYGTDFLQFITNKFDFYKGVIPILEEGIKEAGNNQIIDLASGGGGGWKSISKHLKDKQPHLKIKLTDYYPNLGALKRMQEFDSEIFDYETESVSALDVPEHLKGLRTQFLSFHHFKKEDARQILQNAVDCDSPIAIFEGQVRDFPHLLKNFFSPISVLIATPFITPFSFGRLFFTYILPIVPLFVWWDGIVSVLRTYSVKEMEGLVGELKGNERFEWKIGKHKEKGITVPYLLAYPKKA